MRRRHFGPEITFIQGRGSRLLDCLHLFLHALGAQRSTDLFFQLIVQRFDVFYADLVNEVPALVGEHHGDFTGLQIHNRSLGWGQVVAAFFAHLGAGSLGLDSGKYVSLILKLGKVFASNGAGVKLVGFVLHNFFRVLLALFFSYLAQFDLGGGKRLGMRNEYALQVHFFVDAGIVVIIVFDALVRNLPSLLLHRLIKRLGQDLDSRQIQTLLVLRSLIQTHFMGFVSHY